MMEQLKKEKASFLTSNTSLYETITVVSQRISHKDAVNFLSKVPQGLNTLFINQQREQKAIKFFKKQTSKNISFFDCLNMAIMKEFSIKNIFSFDKGYKKNGFSRIGID